MTLSTPSLLSVVESAQRHADGSPRFCIAASEDSAAWNDAVDTENTEGVSSDVRIFLDAQLENGDVLIDAAPGFGFVALGAVTAPNGMPSVFALNTNATRFAAMSEAARNAGGWVEPFESDDLSACRISEMVSDRLPMDGRAFLHCDLHMLPVMLQQVTPLIVLGKLVACCITVPGDTDHTHFEAAGAALAEAGLELHELREVDGEAQLFRAEQFAAGQCGIALVGQHTASATRAALSDIDAIGNALMAADEVNALINVTDHLPSPVTYMEPVTSNAFSFLAPFCRTGYGIVGAHVLRELLQLDVPVAYFPLGAVDRSIVHIPDLDHALQRQGAYEDAAPSVRLSQQFDLALHVGRGPRIGFPIFELDKFHSNERHQLERQDRLMVTSTWARDVLLENGIWRTPIDIVPLGVDRAVFHEQLRSSAPATTDTVFMSVGKLEPRKGQLELLRAFESAFSPRDPVRLVFVCHNPFVDSATFKTMLKPFHQSKMASRITITTTPFATQRELALYMMSADCAVFPVRAEGWNLEALEMLSLGKTVIASNCTAHTAFLTDENAKLIHIDTMEESVRGEHRGRWASWGTRQHEQLVAQLRDVHARRQHGELEVNTAGVRTAKVHSWTASASAMMKSVTSA